MYELNRVRLYSIGPAGARYADTVLDLSDVGDPVPEPAPRQPGFFDDESAGTANTGQNVITTGAVSRVEYIKLNFQTDTATLIKSDPQPEGLSASSQGNAQPLPGGGAFVGWGNLNYISEFDGAGNLLFNAEFPTGVNTYRAYLLAWNPGPFGHAGGPQRRHVGH